MSEPSNRVGPTGWSAALFTSRESEQVVAAAVEAIVAASRVPTVIDVLVNGNPTLACKVAASMSAHKLESTLTRVRVWCIELGDKAHTWNEYVHRLWPGSEAAFFVDGYVRVNPDALQTLAGSMLAAPDALAATGAPTLGHSARRIREEMRRAGGIHGNLFALKPVAMEDIRRRGFRLPLGIYRTDPTLAAALAFGLDPTMNSWDLKSRVVVDFSASWQTEAKRWWVVSDLRSHFRRLERQAQGDFENRAVSSHLASKKMPAESLPPTAAQLVSDWARANPETFQQMLMESRLRRSAWRRLVESRSWAAAERLPQLLYDSPTGQARS